jgi:manganese/iron transport system ATP-binding protein
VTGAAAARAGAPDLAADGLRLDDVSVTYRSGVTAVDAASFALPQGTITALVGVNGSG